jgi:membrane associated rhomboid family serine protease
VSTPELSVVCRSCGEEVSPYVTECPYCGARLRRRAPKLERGEGDELRVRESLRARRKRIVRERRAGRGRTRSLALATERPYATIGAILAPAVLVVVLKAGGYFATDLGAISYPANRLLPGSADAWHYLVAPFVYDQIGYLFVVGVALALFGSGVERRIGTVATALLYIACGSLGMLAAVGIDRALGDGVILAAGGNGIALGAIGAWTMLRRAEHRDNPGEDFDQIGIVVAASVVLLLPVFEDLAAPWAGVVGGAVGLLAGAVAARFRTTD